MAMPAGPFMPVKHVIEILKGKGCTIREVPPLNTPDGPVKVRYAWNLNTGDYVEIPGDDDEILAPSTIANIARRLNIDLSDDLRPPWIN